MTKVKKKQSKKEYVVGFMFDPDYENVVLIEKKRPVWQAGKLNGVGGKIEKGETPKQAMRREFYEETDVDYPKWIPFTTLEFDDSILHCFKTDYDMMHYVKTNTDEFVGLFNVYTLLMHHKNGLVNMIDNLSWLIPMAQYEKYRINMKVVGENQYA